MSNEPVKTVGDMVRDLLEQPQDAPIGFAVSPGSDLEVASIYRDGHGKVWVDLEGIA